MTADWPPFNDLWDYADPAGTEEKFRDLLPSVRQSGDAGQYLQLLTQVARTLSLRNRFDEAHAILDDVASKMEPGSIVEVRYLLELGRTLNSAKQSDKALPYFEQAVAVARSLGADFYTVDALHMLGIAAPSADRLGWNLAAIKAAEASADDRARNWLGSLLNNTGWALFNEERYDEAHSVFRKAVAFREHQGKAEPIRVAHWCIARVLRALGKPGEALPILRTLEADPDHDGFVEEEIAECLHAQGNTAEAKPYFRVAYTKLSQIDWVAEDTARIRRLESLGG